MSTFMRIIKEMWARATLGQRVLLISVSLVFLGISAMLVHWATRPDMVVLYSGLAPEEAGKIVEKIAEQDVQYELKNGGTTIYAPRGKVSSLRLAMASAGLPSTGQSGYKILDDSKLGMTPFAERVNYIRAIEGELAQSISLLDGVASSRVHIVKPETKLFRGKQKQASATVVLTTAGGYQIRGNQVAAIVHLISGAVEGLSPENVVVVDSVGKLLSGEGGSEVAQGMNSLLDIKAQTEQYLVQKVEKMLSSALGAGKFTVRVDVDIETSNLITTSEAYDPSIKVVKEETINSETTTSAVGATAKGSPGSSTSEDIQTQYALSKTVKQVTEIPGAIKKRSVAVMVDLSGQDAESGGKILATTDIEAIVRNTLGLSSTDSLSVVDAPMTGLVETPLPEIEPEGLIAGVPVLDLARKMSLGLLAVGVLVVLKLFAFPKKRKGAPELGMETQGELAGSESSSQLDVEKMRNRITNAIQENPAEVKRLFLNWVSGGKGS